jgi:hypothetical protein
VTDKKVETRKLQKKQRGFQKSTRVGIKFKIKQNEKIIDFSNYVAYVWFCKCAM